MPKYLTGPNVTDTRDAVDTTSCTRIGDWGGLREATSANHIAGQSHPSPSPDRSRQVLLQLLQEVDCSTAVKARHILLQLP